MATSLIYSATHLPARIVFEKGKNMVNFGIIGYGYWGPNIVRNLDGLEGASSWLFPTSPRPHGNGHKKQPTELS